MRSLLLLLGMLLGGVAAAAPPVTVRYMLWDSLQMPAYRECAADFTQRNPGITIKIAQAGWDDYWTALSTGFIAGVAPDVFTNHLGRYPEFAANGLLEDLTPWLQRSGADVSGLPPLLRQAWSREGRAYGLPKDWDTVALKVNLAHARRAGVSLDELQNLDWNPRDGGRFEQVLRRLTVDTSGRNALHPQFDAARVAVWGYHHPGAGGMTGQTEWSPFALSNGFSYQARPWATPYRYDDPRLAETIDWLATLPRKGLQPRPEHTRNQGVSGLFLAGRVAIVPDGAWMIGFYAAQTRFEHAWVPMPRGPIGQRASLLNGLADSMWSGSKVKAEAWRWMQHLASPDCQRVVARHGVVFPAWQGLAEQVLARHRERGTDASAFLTMAQSHTALMPIGVQAAQIDEVVKFAIESVLLGQQAATPALQAASTRITQLLARRQRPQPTPSNPP